jgi:hypothetical protein
VIAAGLALLVRYGTLLIRACRGFRRRYRAGPLRRPGRGELLHRAHHRPQQSARRAPPTQTVLMVPVVCTAPAGDVVPAPTGPAVDGGGDDDPHDHPAGHRGRGPIVATP